MADRVHEDWLADVFTRFCVEVREESRPPAAQTVRDAVRRRRSVRIAAVVLAVALVGAVVGIAATAHRPHGYPPLTPTQLRELQTQAFDALEPLGIEAGHAVALTAGTHAETYSLNHAASSPDEFAQGEGYDLLAQCVGQGTVILVWQAPGGLIGRGAVVCGGSVFRAHFVPRVDIVAIRFGLTPDAEAIGRALIVVGFAEAH
jgi:hypothetical protein